MSDWYALSTEPRRERVAAAGLAERGIPVFLPMETNFAMERGRITRDLALTPLFTGYIFALLDLRQMADVLGVEGVGRFVSSINDSGEQRPYLFPAQVIIALQVAERRGEFNRTVKRKPPEYRPKKGDKVQVKAGTYITFIGTVLDAPLTSRVRVKLEDGREPKLKVSHLKPAA